EPQAIVPRSKISETTQPGLSWFQRSTQVRRAWAADGVRLRAGAGDVVRRQPAADPSEAASRRLKSAPRGITEGLSSTQVAAEGFAGHLGRNRHARPTRSPSCRRGRVSTARRSRWRSLRAFEDAGIVSEAV